MGSEMCIRDRAFKNVLEKEEKLAAIAYFQNFWDDETYRQWEVMGGVR